MAWAAAGYGLGWRRQWDLVGDLRLARLDQRRRCAEGRLRPDHPAVARDCLPSDVRHHYVSVDTRGVRGADENSAAYALDGEEGYISSRRHQGELA